MSKPATKAARRVIRQRHRKKMAKLKAKRAAKLASREAIPSQSQGALMDPNEVASTVSEAQQASSEIIEEGIEHDLTEEALEQAEEGNTATPLPIVGAEPTTQPAMQAAPNTTEQEIKEPAENNG